MCCMVHTVIGVTGRMFLHSRGTNVKDCCRVGSGTEGNEQIVKLSWLNGCGLDGWDDLVLEVECLFMTDAVTRCGSRLDRLSDGWWFRRGRV